MIFIPLSLDLNFYLNKKVSEYKLAGVSPRSNEVGVRYYDELCNVDQYDQFYSGKSKSSLYSSD